MELGLSAVPYVPFITELPRMQVGENQRYIELWLCAVGQ